MNPIFPTPVSPHHPAEESGGESGPVQFPIVVVTILLLNLLVFILQSITGGSTNTFNLVRFGAQAGAAIENGEYWRFVTAAFLHIGILHLFVNSVCLWQLGTLLEDLYGSTHFGFLYLASGVGGTLTSFFLNEFVSPQTVSAGASGAIFGVAAAMMIAGLRYRDQIPEHLEYAFGTGILPFLAFNLYFGLVSRGVDNYAHIGGLLAGAVLGAVLHPHHESVRDTRLAAAGLAGVVLVCFGLQYRAVVRFERELRSADVLFHAGRVAEAQVLVGQLRKGGTEDARLLTLAAMLDLKQGRVPEALREVREAERIASRYAPAKIVRGEAMMLLRNPVAAAVAFRQAIRLDPQNAAAHASLGGALLALNRAEEAETEFRVAVRLDPRLASGQVGLALTLERQGKPDEAAQAFGTAIVIDPRLMPARHGLVRALLASGRNDEATAEIGKILEIDPADELAQKTLAEIKTLKDR